MPATPYPMVCCYIEQLGLVLVVLLTVNTTEIHLLVRRLFVGTVFFVRVMQQPNCGLGRLIVQVSRSQTDTQPIRFYLWSTYRKVVIVLEFFFVAALIIYKHIVCISVTPTRIYFNTARNKVKGAVFCFENRI
jgi:hypothetical protein